jgi:hypothetical protein
LQPPVARRPSLSVSFEATACRYEQEKRQYLPKIIERYMMR